MNVTTLSKKPTIADVAKRANVSTMTVSRVVNGSGSVSAKRRESVEEAISALGYQPNMAARHLSGSRSNLIGLLYDNPSRHYVSQFLLGAMTECRQHGQHLVVDEYPVAEHLSNDLLDSLLNEHQLEGVILLPPLSDDLTLLDKLEACDLDYIRIAPDKELHRAPYVCMDDYAAAFELTESLIKMGHRQIGFIKGSVKHGASRLRLQGFLDALRSHGIDIPDDWIQPGDFSYKSGLQAAEKLLNRQNRPTAIFASNDDMAAATLAMAHKLSIATPESLSVVGYDDTDIATSIWPQLTTVKQPIYAMAEQAVSMLLSMQVRKSGVDIASQRIVMPFEIVTRESVAPR